jgi:hypothetical protein
MNHGDEQEDFAIRLRNGYRCAWHTSTQISLPQKEVLSIDGAIGVGVAVSEHRADRHPESRSPRVQIRAVDDCVTIEITWQRWGECQPAGRVVIDKLVTTLQEGFGPR